MGNLSTTKESNNVDVEFAPKRVTLEIEGSGEGEIVKSLNIQEDIQSVFLLEQIQKEFGIDVHSPCKLQLFKLGTVQKYIDPDIPNYRLQDWIKEMKALSVSVSGKEECINAMKKYRQGIIKAVLVQPTQINGDRLGNEERKPIEVSNDNNPIPEKVSSEKTTQINRNSLGNLEEIEVSDDNNPIPEKNTSEKITTQINGDSLGNQEEIEVSKDNNPIPEKVSSEKITTQINGDNLGNQEEIEVSKDNNPIPDKNTSEEITTLINGDSLGNQEEIEVSKDNNSIPGKNTSEEISSEELILLLQETIEEKEKEESEPPSKDLVWYDHVPSNENEVLVNFLENVIILGEDESEGMILIEKDSGDKGLIPKSCVQPPLDPPEGFVSVWEDFEAKNDSELSVERFKSVIKIDPEKSEEKEGWLHGTSEGRIGFFPEKIVFLGVKLFMSMKMNNAIEKELNEELNEDEILYNKPSIKTTEISKL